MGEPGMIDPMIAYLLAGMIGCGLIASVIAGARRGNPTAGFVLGLLLGPIGILITFLLGRDETTAD